MGTSCKLWYSYGQIVWFGLGQRKGDSTLYTDVFCIFMCASANTRSAMSLQLWNHVAVHKKSMINDVAVQSVH